MAMKHRVFVGVDALRDVPPPTSKQRARFIEHVCEAHSWYKAYRTSVTQINFAVFLWRDGGFAPQHRGWGNYHELHGYLAYGWRSSPDAPFCVDAGIDVEFDPALLAAASVIVEPYISTNSAATIDGLATDGLESIKTHPRREVLDRLIAYYHEQTHLWNAISQEHREVIVKYYSSGKRVSLPAEPQVAQYLAVNRQLTDTYLMLRAEEIGKLEAAIDRILALQQASS